MKSTVFFHAGGLTISVARESVIDFSLPLYDEPVTLVIRKPEGGIFNVWVYMQCFTLPGEGSFFIKNLKYLHST